MSAGARARLDHTGAHLETSRLLAKLLDNNSKCLRIDTTLAEGDQDGERLPVEARVQKARHFVDGCICEGRASKGREIASGRQIGRCCVHGVSCARATWPPCEAPRTFHCFPRLIDLRFRWQG